ncbi:MAG: hypothetical protein H6780_02195 [Candidatus Nomurabacteria bacterium]|nr:MAG: hypothetical protein H6780_02195 [Candidatus Nomurabacteria bacterium]
MNVKLEEMSRNTINCPMTMRPKGTFIDYRLSVDDGLTFVVVRFLPNIPDARETLTRIKFKPEGSKEQELFAAKKFIKKTGTLVFLAAVDGRWVIYRLVKTAGRPLVDQVWQVTAAGVHYPGVGEQKDPAAAARFKAKLAALEGAEPVYEPAEMPFMKAAQAALQQEEAAAEAALMAKVEAERREAAEKAAAERKVKADAKTAAAQKRAAEKARLMAPGNRRCFKRVDGIDMSGFVVDDLEQAKRLPGGKIAVVLGDDGLHVAKAYFVKKTAGGHFSFDEIEVATESTPYSAASVTASPEAPALKLTGKFLTLVRPEGKRKSGENSVVAQVVTAEELTLLKAHRPGSPRQVALLLPNGAYHAYCVSADSVADLGHMVEQTTEAPVAEKPVEKASGKKPTASKAEKRRKFGMLLVAA